MKQYKQSNCAELSPSNGLTDGRWQSSIVFFTSTHRKIRFTKIMPSLRRRMGVGLLLIVMGGAQAQPALDKFLRTPALKHASVGVSIIDAESGAEVCRTMSEKSLAPASVLKLFTTATALELYGGDYCFQTRLGYSGSIDSKGTLRGDLIIHGTGDPTLGSSMVEQDRTGFLKEWVAAVKNAGIKKIEGRIIGDDSQYDYSPIPVRWTWEDMGNYYAAGVYGLNVYDNRCSVSLRTEGEGSEAKITRCLPEMPRLRFINYLKARNHNLDSAYFYGEPYSWERSIQGSIPMNRKEFWVMADIPDPAQVVADEVKRSLASNGVIVAGEATTQRLITLDGAKKGVEIRKELCVTPSASLREIIKVANHRSFNLYAEAMLRLVATPTAGSPYYAGIQRELTYWRGRGLDVSGVKLSDGSGLSPFNRVTPEMMTQLLRKMTQSSRFADYEASLPRAGMEGSVRSFLDKTSLQGIARVKSGSYEGVLSYAGYVEKEGKRYCFCVIVNGINGGTGYVKAAIERFLCEIL